MTEARARILARLRNNLSVPSRGADSRECGNGLDLPRRPAWDRETRIACFTERMRAVRGEVIRVSMADWRDRLVEILREHQVKTLLASSKVDPISELHGLPPPGIEVRAYDRPIEAFRHELFHDIDATITRSVAGIADTGSLILAPNQNEPRLASLVPPLHIVLLEADRLHVNLAEAMSVHGWQAAMPTNLLLISGPSKSADIEQTLAYGVHGPEALVVLLME